MATEQREPTIEQMVQELTAAGWSLYRGHRTLWVAPWGALYRGPYGAWKVWQKWKALSLAQQLLCGLGDP